MDLSKLDTRYWEEVHAAEQGDRGPLITKLREGIQPTRVDLARFANLFEMKRDAWRPKKARTATARLEEVASPKALAAEQYRRIMGWLADHGGSYGMQQRVNDHVCRQFGIDNPRQFADWRKQAGRQS